MRYGREHKAGTHARILGVASRLFRERGFVSAGVSQVMKAAGLTVGGFYAHFSSKEALLGEAIDQALETSTRPLFATLDPLEGEAWVAALVRGYLSRTHRDAPAAGCPLPAMTADVARAGKPVKKRFETSVRRLVEEATPRVPSEPDLDAEGRVWALLALGVGGLLLARAVCDRELSDRILHACRRFALKSSSQKDSS